MPLVRPRKGSICILLGEGCGSLLFFLFLEECLLGTSAQDLLRTPLLSHPILLCFVGCCSSRRKHRDGCHVCSQRGGCSHCTCPRRPIQGERQCWSIQFVSSRFWCFVFPHHSCQGLFLAIFSNLFQAPCKRIAWRIRCGFFLLPLAVGCDFWRCQERIASCSVCFCRGLPSFQRHGTFVCMHVSPSMPFFRQQTERQAWIRLSFERRQGTLGFASLSIHVVLLHFGIRVVRIVRRRGLVRVLVWERRQESRHVGRRLFAQFYEGRQALGFLSHWKGRDRPGERDLVLLLHVLAQQVQIHACVFQRTHGVWKRSVRATCHLGVRLRRRAHFLQVPDHELRERVCRAFSHALEPGRFGGLSRSRACQSTRIGVAHRRADARCPTTSRVSSQQREDIHVVVEEKGRGEVERRTTIRGDGREAWEGAWRWRRGRVEAWKRTLEGDVQGGGEQNEQCSVGLEIVRMRIGSCCEREGCTCSLAVGERMAKVLPCGRSVIPCFSANLGEVCRFRRFVKTSRPARIRTQQEDLIRTTSLVSAKFSKLLNPSKPSL